MRIGGVDGCKGGWLCIVQEPDGMIAAHCFPTIDELVGQVPKPDLLTIDIPIGLPDTGPRQCDREARGVLKARASSVFPAPLRETLTADSWADACAIRERCEGKRMSKQAWAIVPKIAEVDAALRRDPSLREWVREVHPEVCFWAWRGEPMPHRKKTSQGKQPRRELVDRHFGEQAFDAVRQGFRRRDVADDDILDAFAALWTAERSLRGQAQTLPTDPPRDCYGLRMEIVY